MRDAVAILVALARLAGNAFFVGAEFALISARRTRIEPLAAQGRRGARTTLRAMERVSLMMAGAQLGITACSLGLGAVAEPAVASLIERPMEALGVPEALLHPIAFTIALAIVVFLHMVLGEMVPKNIAIAGPERSALLLAPVLSAVVTVLKPLILAPNGVSNGVLHLFGVEAKDEVASTFDTAEVGGLIAESRREGLLDADEEELLTSALRFGEQDVSTVLLARDQLTVLAVDATPRQVQEATARTGYSRFPLADATGALTGYLHVKDALRSLRQAGETAPAGRLSRPLPVVAAGDPLRTAPQVMQADGAHLAAVTGADGQVLGCSARSPGPTRSRPSCAGFCDRTESCWCSSTAALATGSARFGCGHCRASTPRPTEPGWRPGRSTSSVWRGRRRAGSARWTSRWKTSRGFPPSWRPSWPRRHGAAGAPGSRCPPACTLCACGAPPGPVRWCRTRHHGRRSPPE